MADARQNGTNEDKSLGDLVALATRDLSNLVRSEMELAKLELKGDAKKAALGATLFAVAGVIACVIVILLSIALAFGFVAMGVWTWAAFLIVSGLYALLAAGLVGWGIMRMRRMTKLQRTIRTAKDDLAMLRRGDDDEAEAEAEITAGKAPAVEASADR